MVDDGDIPPVRSLRDVIRDQVNEMNKPEYEIRVLGWVETALKSVATEKDRYLFRHRGKVIRKEEVRALGRRARDLGGEHSAPVSDIEWAVMQGLLNEIGLQAPKCPQKTKDQAAILRWAASQLRPATPFKLDRGWRPYLYGTRLPELGLREAWIEPKLNKDATGERHQGLVLDFIRACLAWLGEDDVAPETIAHELKKRMVRPTDPQGPMELALNRRPWSFQEPPALYGRLRLTKSKSEISPPVR